MADAPPPPHQVLFARGVIARLAIWPALRLAVSNSWGGPPSVSVSKRTWLASELVDAFTSNQVGEQGSEEEDVEWVAEMLAQVMEDEFDCTLGDGSEEAVARDIVKLWPEVARGGTEAEEKVLRWERDAEGARGTAVVAHEQAPEGSDWEDDSDSGSDDGEGGGEVPRLLDHSREDRERQEPVVDEDGFTLVQPRKR
ncbi:hypothetical protein PLICRDRAFT_239024 [Plicaturopsis crispa FD-325 SS-3]|nr:hypothetical protein PLICRDRAFT_239024 [Plicaturopsis crispa FD-325 SS-3]